MGFAGKIHILVVDDDALIREGFAAVLAHEGYTVATARDGLDALEALGRQPAHLLVTDLRMPRLDGYGLIARVRRTHPRLPIIAVTGELPSREMKALSEGSGHRLVVLSKPVMFPRFLNTARGLLAAAQPFDSGVGSYLSSFSAL